MYTSSTTSSAAGDREIRPERPDDHPAVRRLHELAFDGDARIPQLVDALRDTSAPLPPVSLVATTADDEVIGHVMLSAAWLDAPRRLVDVYTLTPLGVLPDRQSRGVGTRLIREALAVAGSNGVPLVFLEGSPRYYRDRGFEPAVPIGFHPPSLRIPEPAFQVARLDGYEPWMTGMFVYRDVFWAHDCVGLRETP